MKRTVRFSAVGIAVLLAACANEPDPPSTREARVALGYHGPLPSVEARKALKVLGGRSFKDMTGACGGGEWVVGAFGVVPNPVTGKGPVVYIERPDSVGTPVPYAKEAPGRRWMPMNDDDDVSQFYELVTGEAPKLLDETRTPPK